MIHEYHNPKLDANLVLSSCERIADASQKADNFMKIIWNNSKDCLQLNVDGLNMQLKPNHVLYATYVQKVRFAGFKIEKDVYLLSFNPPFYCIHTNDSEVSCGGLLFFGSSQTPVIALDTDTKKNMHTILEMLVIEFGNIDSNQEEMLRLLLKQCIIRCTRLARQQLLKGANSSFTHTQVDIIRKFNLLVEEHFREKKQVGDYAALMFKSPKTIGNIFRKLSDKSPLEVIHDRVLVEAKRLLYYTDKSSREITFELGFDDPAQFSRFFKNKTGKSPTEFKESHNVNVYG